MRKLATDGVNSEKLPLQMRGALLFWRLVENSLTGPVRLAAAGRRAHSDGQRCEGSLLEVTRVRGSGRATDVHSFEFAVVVIDTVAARLQLSKRPCSLALLWHVLSKRGCDVAGGGECLVSVLREEVRGNEGS